MQNPKNRRVRIIAQYCRAVSSQLTHVSIIGKKLVKQQYLLHMSPLVAEICWRVWGTPANFSRFCILALLLQRRRSPEANQTLYDVWLSPVLIHYLYIFGGSCPWWNFATCKIHFASKSCILLYWQCYCTALQQWGQPNFAALYKEWSYGTFAEGTTYIRLGDHHFVHRPTF